MGVIILSSRLDVGYHGRPITSFETVCQDSKNQHPSDRIFSGFLGDHFEASCFIECLGSSRKNLRSWSVPINHLQLTLLTEHQFIIWLAP